MGEEVKALQEQYEVRLRSLASFLQTTNEDLRSDDIVAAMRADPLTAPYAQQRSKEVWESALAQEREDTIARLMKELAEAKRTIGSLENRLSETQRAARSAEDRVRAEVEKADTLTREAELIHKKASVSSMNYEEAMRKKESEAQTSIAKEQAAHEALRRDYDRLESDLGRKAEELEATYQELAECSEVIRRLEQDLDATTSQATRQEERLQFYEKLSSEFQHADGLTQERINSLTSDLARLQSELSDMQAQRDRLALQLKEETDSHRQQQAVISRTHSDTERALEQRLEGETQTLRDKVMTWRSRCQDSELRFQDSQRSLEAVRMHWQQDLSRLQSEQERSVLQLESKLSEADEDYKRRAAELKQEFDNREAALHKHYKDLVLEKSRLDETERSSEREQWKATERSLNGKLSDIMEDLRENYVHLEDHERALETKDEALAQAIKRARENQDSDWTARLKEETDRVRDQQRPVIESLTSRIKAFEADRDVALLEKRKCADDLRQTQEEVGKLRTALNSLHEELSEARKGLVEMTSRAEQAEREVGRLKAALEQARNGELELEKTKVRLEREVSALQESLRQQELAHIASSKDQAAADREQRRLLEGESEQFRLLSDQIRKELESYKDVCKDLEMEVQVARSEVVHSDFQPSPILKSRDEEERFAGRLEREARPKPSATETELMETRSNLAAIQSTYKELKDKCVGLEERLRRTEVAKNSLETALRHSERALKDLRVRVEAGSKGPKAKLHALSKQVRRLKSGVQTELSRLQTDVFKQLQEGKQAFSSLAARGVMGVDELALTLQREYHRRIVEREEDLESLQGDFTRLKEESEEQAKLREGRTCREAGKLAEERSKVERELKTVLEERKALAYQLEQLRLETINQGSALRDAQNVCRQVQAEKMEVEDSRAREVARLQAENRAIQSLSEQSLQTLKTQLTALQQRPSTDSLVQSLQSELQDRSSKLANIQSLARSQDSEIATLKAELLRLQQQVDSSALELQVEDLVSQANRSLGRLRLPARGGKEESETRPYRQRTTLLSPARR